MFNSELLEKCTNMWTTDPTESVIAQILRCALKHLSLGKPTVDTSLPMAILEFKKGSSGCIYVLDDLSIHSEHHFMKYISLSTRK